MAESETNPEFHPLGRLASLTGLLAIALYFTGWAYRLTYFGFFKIQVTSLNLPFESFYFAAFRSLFGNPLIAFRTLIILVFVVLGILASLKGLQLLKRKFQSHLRLNLDPFPLKLVQYLASLTNELVIVLWLLTALFILGQWQAERDAWTDAVNETSELPVVTVLIAENNAALGRLLKDPFSDPSGFRVIGDRNLYKELLGQEVTDTSNLEAKRVWRLLIDCDGYFYIFPALPTKDRKQSVPVLIVYETGNGDQLTILSPRASEK